MRVRTRISARRQAAALRRRRDRRVPGDTVHKPDAGRRFTVIHFGESLMLERLTPSICTLGTCLDNALPENHHGAVQNDRPTQLPVLVLSYPYRRGEVGSKL